MAGLEGGIRCGFLCNNLNTHSVEPLKPHSPILRNTFALHPTYWTSLQSEKYAFVVTRTSPFRELLEFCGANGIFAGCPLWITFVKPDSSFPTFSLRLSDRSLLSTPLPSYIRGGRLFWRAFWRRHS
jgi:hypothetical protein